jgi:hypothetical protein
MERGREAMGVWIEAVTAEETVNRRAYDKRFYADKKEGRISFAERLAGNPEMMQQFDFCAAANNVTSLAWNSQHSAQYALHCWDCI